MHLLGRTGVERKPDIGSLNSFRQELSGRLAGPHWRLQARKGSLRTRRKAISDAGSDIDALINRLGGADVRIPKGDGDQADVRKEDVWKFGNALAIKHLYEGIGIAPDAKKFVDWDDGHVLGNTQDPSDSITSNSEAAQLSEENVTHMWDNVQPPNSDGGNHWQETATSVNENAAIPAGTTNFPVGKDDDMDASDPVIWSGGDIGSTSATSSLPSECAGDNSDQKGRSEALPDIPGKLININAYLMWVNDGKPSRADYSETSKNMLMDKLRSGRSLSEIEAEVCRARNLRLRSSMGLNYYGLVYSIIFEFGDTGRFAVVLRDDDGETFDLQIVTDSAKDLVMHWGICYESNMSDWTRPSEDILPSASSFPGDSNAAETFFEPMGHDGLRRIAFSIAKSKEIRGMQFVLRHANGSRWFWDGDERENFKLPIPKRNALQKVLG